MTFTGGAMRRAAALLATVTGLACGTLDSDGSMPAALSDQSAAAPGPLSPAKLPGLPGLELGASRTQATGRLLAAGVRVDSSKPEVAIGRITLNGQPARMYLSFDHDRVSGVSILLTSVPDGQEQRERFFRQQATFLRHIYGPGDGDDQSLVLQWYDQQQHVAFLWRESAGVFELVFMEPVRCGGVGQDPPHSN